MAGARVTSPAGDDPAGGRHGEIPPPDRRGTRRAAQIAGHRRRRGGGLVRRSPVIPRQGAIRSPCSTASPRPPGATGRQVHLILSGWAANESIRGCIPRGSPGFRDRRAGHVRRQPGAGTRFGIWHAADLFTSLSDNIQETFGLVMIAGHGVRPPGGRLRLEWLPGPGRRRRDGLPRAHLHGQGRHVQQHRATLDGGDQFRPLPGRMQPGGGRRPSRRVRGLRAADRRRVAAPADGGRGAAARAGALRLAPHRRGL